MQKISQNEEIKNMSELKPRITENGIDYILVGDYYIPDLKLPEEHRPIGKYDLSAPLRRYFYLM